LSFPFKLLFFNLLILKETENLEEANLSFLFRCLDPFGKQARTLEKQGEVKAEFYFKKS